MIATSWSIVLAAAVGAGPAPVPPAPVQQPPAASMAPAPMAPGTVIAGTPAAVEACGGCPDPRYPFDAQDAWIHGYLQEVTAYGGFTAFRPYNYKHVLAQSQVAASWGMSPTAPYSQSFWHDPVPSTTKEGLAQWRPPVLPVRRPPIAAERHAGPLIIPASGQFRVEPEPWPHAPANR